jgi:hypothetical protein
MNRGKEVGKKERKEPGQEQGIKQIKNICTSSVSINLFPCKKEELRIGGVCYIPE